MRLDVTNRHLAVTQFIERGAFVEHFHVHRCFCGALSRTPVLSWSIFTYIGAFVEHFHVHRCFCGAFSRTSVVLWITFQFML